MNESINILLCGLGGQGVALAARIISEAAFADGHRVLTADVPPISQRFAPIESFVRIGEDIYSETFPEGEADLLLAFDPLQCLKKGLAFAREGGTVIMNERALDIRPYPSFTYPTINQILRYLDKIGVRDVRHLNASDLAIKETGSIQATNAVMLGAAFATGMIPVREAVFESTIRRLVPGAAVEANLKAFRVGIEALR